VHHPRFPDVWNDCDTDINVGSIRIGLAVFAFDAFLQPAEIRVKLNDKKFAVCHWAVDKLAPVAPPIWKLAPEVNIGGVVGDIINGLLGAPFGALESLFSGSLLDLYAAMSFVGFGLANPLKHDCP
jgi:hypothetical protein